MRNGLDAFSDHKGAEMVKRAVLYARVSGDDRKQESRNLEGQIEMCRDYAQQNGWRIVAELPEDDRGASGAEIDLPKLNQAREMAEAGEYDILVVREIDRLSRNLHSANQRSRDTIFQSAWSLAQAKKNRAILCRTVTAAATQSYDGDGPIP